MRKGHYIFHQGRTTKMKIKLCQFFGVGLILCACFVKTQGQISTSDSLLHVLRQAKVKSPTNKKLHLHLLNQISEALLKEGSVNALVYIRKALVLGNQTNYKSDKLHSLVVMALYYQKNDHPQQAIKYFKKALEVAKKEKFHARSAEISLHIGECYRAFNEIKSSLFHYFEAASFYRKIPDQMGYLEVINRVAGSFYDIGEYRKSLKYFMEVMQTAQKIKKTRLIAIALNNVGSTYNILGSHDKAIEYLERGLKLVTSHKKLRRIKGALLSSIGEVKLAQDNIASALQYFNQAWEIAQKIQNEHLLVVVTRDLAKVYARKNDFKMALDYELKSLKAAKKRKDLHQIQESYFLLSKIYKQARDFEQALYYYSQYHQLKDSSHLNTQLVTTRRLELKYQNAQKEKEIALLTKEKEIQEAKFKQRQNAIYLSIAVFLLLLIPSLLYYRHYKGKKHTRILFEERNKIIATQNEKIKEQTYHMERKHEELKTKNQALIELNQEKNLLVGVLAHDLRSPLHQVKGLLQLAQMASISENELASYLQKAMQSTERLQDMIDRLLDLKVVEEKELQLKLEKINVHQLLKEVIQSFEEQAHKKLIQIHLAANLPHSPQVRLDRNYTLQIFENLLSNAIKFSPPHKQITFDIQQISRSIQVSITDEGPGISVADQTKLFGKFQRLSAKPTGGENSVGLGLSIVKKFVETMGGQIWCESRPGEGTRFIVEFALA